MAEKPTSETAQPNWGGKRTGAGRKKKATIAPVVVAGIDLARALATPPPDEIDAYLRSRGQGSRSINALGQQLIYGTSEAAKIAAAITILDRSYGKPAVEIGGDAAMLPFMASPDAATAASDAAALRAEARKWAPLAIEVLEKIRDNGASEAARTRAANVLIEREYGTVGKARLPDELRERPLGKKEEAIRAAETAATGRYATPPPPRQLNAAA